MKKSITICVANHKGGVAKTTTAVTLGAYLAALGYPTILVDCDPQGHVAKFLNLEASTGLYDLVVTRARPAEVLQRYKDTKLCAITNTPKAISAIETLLRTSDMIEPGSALKTPLSQFASANGKPTIIIIDTSPTITSVQLMALNAADWLIIPATPTYTSETGVDALCRAVKTLQGQGASLNLLGILPTMFDGRYKGHQATVPQWEATFPGLILPVIRRLSVIEEAAAAGVSLWEHAPKSKAAEEYAIVIEEVRRRVGI